MAVLKFEEFLFESKDEKWKKEQRAKIDELKSKIANYKSFSPAELKSLEKDLKTLEDELKNPNGSEQH